MTGMNGVDVIQRFRGIASTQPGRPALIAGGDTLSYAELERWSDALAARVAHATDASARVAVIARKEASTYAAILGILKAGRTYVPLPPEGPAVRWQRMLDRTEAAACMAAPDAPAGLPVIATARGDGAPPPVEPDPGRDAYILFTSGSTGGPKGVRITHGNLSAYIGHARSLGHFSADDRFTQLFALTFDLSLHDLFVPWSLGACVVVPDEGDALSPAGYVRRHGITAWFSSPSLAALMERTRALGPGAMPTLRHAFFCGEALHQGTVRAFARAAPAAAIVNLYGPTETTIAVTAYQVPVINAADTGIVPIGRPFPGHRHRLVEEELWISGPQVSPGYAGDAEATDRAFVTGPDGVRWYRTGDRARMGTDDVLHFRGRIDDQVKVRGHRVEPAEVDAAVRTFPGAGHCLTVPSEGTGTTRLITFIDGPCESTRLLQHLREQLPAHMVPERIVQLPELPLNAHGKVDREQLKRLAAHG